MKKIIIFLISILLLAGCNNSSEDDSYKKLFLQNIMSEKNRYDKTIPDIVPVYNKECHTELNDESEKKWLILMYLAGDSDSIEKDLLGNMVSVSIGMSHSNADIKTIALYDRHSDLTEKPNYIIIDSGTHIFDIKPNSSCTEQFIADYCKTDVPDLDWLHVDSTGKTEADTGSYMTMGNFIKWAEETYNPDNERRTIFIVGSHGFGTTGTVSSRTFCPDHNSRNIIHTNEIPKAFDYAGITSENKFEAVIYDVCLCGTLEEAYEIRNYAKSFICSSNETPKAGFPYEKIIANICKNTTICEIGTNFVNCFANDYKTKSYKNRPATISFIDLSKIEKIAVTTTDLSNELLPDVSFIKSNKYLKNEGYESKNNVNYECSYIIGVTATSVNYTKFYSYDLGFFADKLYDYAVKNSLINVSEHCTTLKNQLSQAVVCSWRGNNNKTENGSYPEFNNSSNYYGLTITGDAENSKNPYNLTTFAFNTDTTWKKLLTELYPEQFQ
ncbi:MAG: clostripain-related cysteine peptidase [Treponema sp.]|nr:clostripain-related cysteine peptidase [Treponema sp.]